MLLLAVLRLLREVVDFVDYVEECLGFDLLVWDSVGLLVCLLEQRVVVGALNHHHSRAEFFLGRLVEVIDKRCELVEGLLLEV